MRGEAIINPVTRAGGNLEMAVRWEKGVASKALVSGLCSRNMSGKMLGKTPEKAASLSLRICGECGFSHLLACRNAIRGIQGQLPACPQQEELALAIHMILGHLKNFYFSILPDYGRFPSALPFVMEGEEQADCRLEEPVLRQMTQNRERVWKAVGKVSQAVSPLTGKWVHGQVTEGTRLDRSAVFELKKAIALLRQLSAALERDAELLSAAYQDYFYIGAGNTNFIDFGCFPEWYCRGGWKNPLRSGEVIPEHISLDFSHSWREEDGRLDFSKKGAYSQLFSAGYQQMPYEMGPVARWRLGEEKPGGSSVMERLMAIRAETAALCQGAENLLEQAQEPGRVSSVQRQSGRGLGVAPCCGGSVLHLAEMEEGRITGYYIVSPCHWNLAPQNGQGNPSPVQTAVLGTQFPEKETGLLAVRRILRSFSPCLYCGG